MTYRSRHTRASDVEIRNPDGSTELRRPYNAVELTTVVAARRTRAIRRAVQATRHPILTAYLQLINADN